jgi:hypothetical protein
MPQVQMHVLCKPNNRDLLTAYAGLYTSYQVPTSAGDRDKDGTGTATVGLAVC